MMMRELWRGESVRARNRVRGLTLICASAAVALVISACGSSRSPSSSSQSQTNGASVAGPPATTAAPAPLPLAARLRILAPRRGASAASTLTVRVSLTGATAAGSRAFKYVLDGSLTRLGSARLSYHDLAAGQHHLLVALASRPSVSARVSFSVPVPPPRPAGPSSAATPPASTTAAPPPPPSSTQAAAPATTPAPSGGIPQGANAGDADSDNQGGPSDGDGNI
jgi:hypothetical protein